MQQIWLNACNDVRGFSSAGGSARAYGLLGEAYEIGWKLQATIMSCRIPMRLARSTGSHTVAETNLLVDECAKSAHDF